jgi:flagellar protein FliS
MSYGRAQDAYQQSSVLNLRREELVPLLYEHLLVSLRRASKQITSGDFEGKAASIDKATSILYELMGTLDFEVGGEVASRLASLYAYFLKEISRASKDLEAQRLAPLIEMVSSLHESWVEAVKIATGPGDEGEGEAEMEGRAQ